MISKIITAAVLIAIGAGGMYYALGHHILRTQDGIVRVPKAQLQLEDTFHDIRDWGAQDFLDRPRVTQALIEHGHGHLVPQQAGDNFMGKLKDAWERIIGSD